MFDVAFESFGTTRKGIYVRLSDHKGFVGLGEIAPLPGFSKESYVDVLEQVQLLPKLLKRPVFPDTINWYPSVAFGLESALLTYLASQKNLALADYLSPDAAKSVPKNALIMGEPKTWESHLLAARVRGISVFKIKIGRHDLESEIETISYLGRDVLLDSETLRLDANRSWDMDMWLVAEREWRGLPIAYVEEPLKDLSMLNQFYDHIAIAIALDETFREWPITKVLEVPGLTTLIVKPTLMGRVSEVPRHSGMDLVLSSSFESEVGLSILEEWAKVLSPGVACGLDTLGGVG
ncbi:MAG: o-succinylbenzoate synthase [Candidatus Margulisbacteria bacterium]|nr:o-succinylbenzoate synthase [Candidatus Margulisiibacteriota bacterium]